MLWSGGGGCDVVSSGTGWSGVGVGGEIAGGRKCDVK